MRSEDRQPWALYDARLCAVYLLYCSFLPESRNNKEAYEKAESVYALRYGRRAYKSYNTFRVLISRKKKIIRKLAK